MFDLGVAREQQWLVRSVCSLTTVTWCNCKNTFLFIHVMCWRCECSILDVGIIFNNAYEAVSHGIPAEFQWNSMDSIGNDSCKLPDSNPFYQNSLEKTGNFHGIENQNGWSSSQLLSIEIPWNSVEFQLSTNFPLKSSRTYRISWRRVKTSISPTSVEHAAGFDTSTRPVTPSEQTSGSSQSQTAPDLGFFLEYGSKVPPMSRPWCKTCKYVVLHNFIHCTDKDCCSGQTG